MIGVESSHAKTSQIGISGDYVTGLCEASATFTYLKNGAALNLRFAVKLPKSNKDLIFRLQRFFEGGNVYHHGGGWMYCATSLAAIEKIIAHFHRYPLCGSKNREFVVWQQMYALKRIARKSDPQALQALAQELSSLKRSHD